MPRYAIAHWFRDDATATDRRASLSREIARCAQMWAETDSLALVETAETLAELEARLYLDSGLNASKDRLLVIALGTNTATARGVFVDRETLRAILPGIAIA